MLLKELGYSSPLENYRKEKNLSSFDVGRVIAEHRERYIVKTEIGEFEAEVMGNLRFTAKDRSEFPAVGDWVAITNYDDDKALINSVFPRKTVIERTAVGKYGEKQIIATNIDYALIVQAVDRDYNINRIERYLTICYNSGVEPILILNKIDLINEAELTNIIKGVKSRIKELPIISISNETRVGYNDLLNHILKGHTYCLLGSSGVGKSSLVNNLQGETLMKTKSISLSTKKGRHVTSHRELFILDNGAILIDSPGMREVGIADATHGLEIAFETIIKLSRKCKFSDCTHIHESGCAIIKAIESGELDKDSYDNYLRMEREKTHYDSTVAEKRKKDKDFGKMIKNYKKGRKQNKY